MTNSAHSRGVELQTMPLNFRYIDNKTGEIKYYEGELGFLELSRDLEDGCISPYIGEFSQDTGLKDNNGKSIYTGDIVKFGKVHGVVRYDNGVIKYYRLNEQYFFITEAREVEAIGNIWENPELLEKSDE